MALLAFTYTFNYESSRRTCKRSDCTISFSARTQVGTRLGWERDDTVEQEKRGRSGGVEEALAEAGRRGLEVAVGVDTHEVLVHRLAGLDAREVPARVVRERHRTRRVGARLVVETQRRRAVRLVPQRVHQRTLECACAFDEYHRDTKTTSGTVSASVQLLSY